MTACYGTRPKARELVGNVETASDWEGGQGLRSRVKRYSKGFHWQNLNQTGKEGRNLEYRFWTHPVHQGRVHN